jgi:hypothetical protein
MTKKNSGQAPAPTDRRQTNRKKLIIDVIFDGGEATGIANTLDIGTGGLYMVTDAKLETGALISIRITISRKEIVLDAVVVYTDPGYGVGVRFLHPSDEAKSLLSELA